MEQPASWLAAPQATGQNFRCPDVFCSRSFDHRASRRRLELGRGGRCRMPLVDLNLMIAAASVPGEVCRFLREAERRIERFQRTSRISDFVPSDCGRAYGVLRALAAADLAPGHLFCEWGSGFGVV